METNELQCPKCGSTQITANKKGFSGGKAVAGAVLTGGIGLLAGTIGSKKTKITCLACGHTFKPGEDKASAEKFNQQKAEMQKKPIFWIVAVCFFALAVLLIRSCINA